MQSLKMGLLGFCALFIVLSIPVPGEAYRILGVFPFNGKSHFMMFEAMMKSLAIRGHQVDVIGHWPLKEPFPNYNDIINLAGSLPTLHNNMSFNFATKELVDSSLVVTIATQLGGDFCNLMGGPQFQNLIKNPPKNPPYDVVVVEIFGSPCYLALGHHLNVPVIAMVTSPIWPWVNEMVGNPENPSYIPNVFSRLSGEMNYWQRISNTFSLWRAKWQFDYHTANQDEKIKKYIGPHARSLEDAKNDVSLVLVNSHYSLHGVRPFTTAVVEVAGLHIKQDGTPLPKDLQKWLDDSTDGFILITFGSMLRIETFPKETLAALYSSLKKLAPIRVLIKVARPKDLPPGLPSNVLTLTWVPQTAVLQHKNIRAFMTHGGLMGTQEAMYYGVPMIGVPFYADQTQNIEFYEQKNIAVAMDYDQMTEENLDKAFNTILQDPIYMASAKKLSAEFQDRPMSPADTAVFWIEYVIRHGGKNIRSPSLNLAWWQLAQLDVYGTLLVAIALVFYLFKVILYKIVNVAFSTDLKKTSKARKNE